MLHKQKTPQILVEEFFYAFFEGESVTIQDQRKNLRIFHIMQKFLKV